MRQGDKRIFLGRFATVEEAVLCVARDTAASAAVARPAARAPGSPMEPPAAPHGRMRFGRE